MYMSFGMPHDDPKVLKNFSRKSVARSFSQSNSMFYTKSTFRSIYRCRIQCLRFCKLDDIIFNCSKIISRFGNCTLSRCLKTRKVHIIGNTPSSQVSTGPSLLIINFGNVCYSLSHL